MELNMQKPKVVFLGSGPVAAKSLELLTKNFNIECVITKPKPAHHRGNFPVLDVVENYGLNKIKVTNKAELDELIHKNKFESQIGIIIDFGIIVNKEVIDSFKYGIVNSHFSLLPQWRGADPITFSILSGQLKTGVSLMVIDEGMDTGKLITSRSISILPYDTSSSLTERLIMLSDELLNDYLPSYLSGDIKPKRQPHPDRATYSRKITKGDGIIDWNKPAEVIEREIRAFQDWPKSHTNLFGKEVIITKAHLVPSKNPKDKPGETIILPEIGELGVATSNGTLWIEKIKPNGKQEMASADFIRGYVK